MKSFEQTVREIAERENRFYLVNKGNLTFNPEFTAKKNIVAFIYGYEYDYVDKCVQNNRKAIYAQRR